MLIGKKIGEFFGRGDYPIPGGDSPTDYTGIMKKVMDEYSTYKNLLGVNFERSVLFSECGTKTFRVGRK